MSLSYRCVDLRSVWSLIVFSLPLFLLSSLHSAPVYGQEAEVKSYLEGVFENANSWRQFDFLVEIEFVSLDPAGPQSVVTGRHRVIMDKDTGKVMVVKFQEYENAENPDDKLTKTATFHASVTVDGLLWFVSDRGGPYKLDLSRLPKILSSAEIIDPRKIGCVIERGHIFGTPDKNHSFEKMYEGLKSVKPVGKVLNGKDDVLVTAKSAYQDPQNPVTTFSHVFSKESMLPVSNKMSHAASNGIIFGSDERIRWARINNAWVPIHYTGTHQSRSAKQGEATFFDESYTYKIHWFSVNEKIDEKLFDSQVCEDRAYALSLIDPVKLNATTLLEDEGQGKRK
jgi:hypothetical protein